VRKACALTSRRGQLITLPRWVHPELEAEDGQGDSQEEETPL